MGWVITLFGVVLAIFAIAGAVMLLRRYCIGWRCDARNLWSVCDEWWQKLYWLWAPREEKVGLVKAQHPTAQTVPGLYNHTANTSQQLSQSNSDLCLNAQGAFTRFEAVDHDLHPPVGSGNAIPPQPLRPAPRPRPSPLHTPNALDYIRSQNSNPGPLTPPPFLANASTPRTNQSAAPPSAFLFQSSPLKSNYSPFKLQQQQNMSRFENYLSRNVPENIQMTSYTIQNKPDISVFDFDPSILINNNNNNNGMPRTKYKIEEPEDCRREYLSKRNDFPRPYDDEFTKIRYNVQGAPLSEHEFSLEQEGGLRSSTPPYGSYDIIQRRHRNEIQSNNGFVRNIIDSIYGPEVVTRQTLLQQANDNLCGASDPGPRNELIHLGRNEGAEEPDDSEDGLIPCFESHRTSSSKLQGLQRVSQYIQSLPDRPAMETDNDRMISCLEEQTITSPESVSTPTVRSEATSSPLPPPPPAPPDPPNQSESLLRQKGQTTGERIFSVLRSVTSQSYIDAAEFYNTFLNSPQKVTFPSHQRSSTLENSGLNTNLNTTEDVYFEKDSSDDIIKRSSDLYSPELNLEAHRTAQEVYNSLQDPPASPLLLKDLNQESYSYTLDPSLSRTSEDIFNSLEQRKKSMERLNGYHDMAELSQCDPIRRQSFHDLYSTIDDLKIKRPLSQSLESCIFPTSSSEFIDFFSMYRRNSLGVDLEPPPDESNLFRATSCETVCSDTSVILKDSPIVGEICIGWEYERWSGRGVDGEGDLTVSVLEARKLKTPDGKEAYHTFVRICLMPDKLEERTRLYRDTPSPSYQEKFMFLLKESHTDRTLLIQVFSVDDLKEEAILLGEATLRLYPPPRPSATTWLPLTGLPTNPHLGELLFSLSYSPTSKKLTIVVVKASNLRGINATPGDYFVKVYLLQDRKKLNIKRTQTKKGERSPIFNESITFNMSNYALQTVHFRLTVAEVNNEQGANTKAHTVGHVIVGSTAKGKEYEHWRQMLAAQRRPVGMWHHLRI